jgi:hypothetical protein
VYAYNPMTQGNALWRVGWWGLVPALPWVESQAVAAVRRSVRWPAAGWARRWGPPRPENRRIDTGILTVDTN